MQVWQQRCELVLDQLAAYPCVRPHGGWSLLIETGTLFAKELPPEAGSYFADVIQRHGMPPGIARVMRHIPPGQISEQERAGLFPAGRFDVLGTGTSHIHTTNTLPGGEVIMVPAVWVLVRPRHGG